MTDTSTKINHPDLTTPVGTIVRLPSGALMAAKDGALAKIRSVDGDVSGRGYLDIEWLKGHTSEAGTQRDGGYMPSLFEICEFQVGDRVRVVAGAVRSEIGSIGKITSFAPLNGDDVVVTFESGISLSYKLDSLEHFPEPEVIEAPAFSEGDVVVIDCPEMAYWDGLRFVVNPDTGYTGKLYLTNGSIDSRPDWLSGNFFWSIDKLRAFDPDLDFKVGDLVGGARYASKGAVTDLGCKGFGDITIDWTEGHPALVESGPIGATRESLTVIGIAPAPEPEPFEPEFREGDRLEVVGNDHANPSGEHCYAEGAIVTVIADAKEDGSVRVEGPAAGWNDTVPQTLLVTDLVVAPEPEAKKLEVGDRVKVIDNSGSGRAVLDALGVVVRRGEDEGLGCLLAVLQDHGVECEQFEHRFERADEPMPLKVGDEITSIKALYAMGVGSVVVIETDKKSPMVKLHDGKFGRINRYALKGDSWDHTLTAYDNTAALHADIESDRKVTVVYLSGESI